MSQKLAENMGISLVGVSSGAVATADFDSDGDIDILLTGIDSSSNRISKVYTNDGSGGFSDNTGISLTGVYLSAVATTDFDSDGDTDILLTGRDSSSNRISKVYTNDGSGEFSENAGISLTGVSSGAVATADFDSDGHADILLIGIDSPSSRITTIYTNDGSGGFSENTGISLASVWNGAVATADLDSDGDTDILLTGYDNSFNHISKVYTNDGSGGFSENTGISLIGVWRSAVATADFDSDGDIDILLTGSDSSSNHISKVYTNDGSGGFSENTGISLAGVSSGAAATADLDSDGDTDILLTGYDSSSNHISKVYTNDGSGGFSENTGMSLAGVGSGAVATADFNSDGKTDILLTGSDSSANHISKVYTQTDGPIVISFTPADDATSAAAGTDLVIEFDEDVVAGSGNIVIKQASDDTPVATIDVNSSEVSISGSTVTINPTSDLVEGIEYYLEIDAGAIEDTSGNGNLKISDRRAWNFTTSSFPENTSISLTGVRNSSVAATDLNNDGYIDILLTGGEGSFTPITGKVYSNNGSGGFSENSSVSLAALSNTSVATADLDNDGDTDVLLTGIDSSWNPISKVYTNDGSGGLSENTSTSLRNVGFGSVATADLDNDGDNDILLTGTDSSYNRISKIYINNGSGGFSENTSISLTGVSYSSVAVSDLNNDGDNDILLTGVDSSFNEISKVYISDGSGGFSENTGISLMGVRDSSVATADLDNDGDTDILLTGQDSSSNPISKVYANDGSGGFSENTSISLTGVRDSSVATTDLDNDGDTDILLTGWSSSDIISKVYTNNGSGGFSENTSISLTGVGFGSVATADLDNDGDNDILLTGETSRNSNHSSSVSKVYTNNTPDTTAPTATSFTPADDATGIAVDADLAIAFDENVVAGTGNIVIKQASDDTPVATIDVNSGEVSISGTTVTINPTSDLSAGTEYYVEIDADAIEDTSGNDYAGITGNSIWNFTTTETVEFDFNKDGVPDILWRNTTNGSNQIWLMNNDGTRNSIAFPGGAATEFQVQEVTDFNGDTVPDIFWRNSTNGSNHIWLMNNDGTRNSIAFPGGAATEFQVEEVTDFNGDTVPDIFWRSTTQGINHIWLMNNDGTRNSIAFPGGAATEFQVEEVTDFNGDTVPDIFWRNSTNGSNHIWLMNNDGTRNSIAFPGGSSIQVAEVTDFSGDGIPDIFWRDPITGSNQIWLMNNDGTRNSIASPGGASSDFQVAEVTDFSGDGVPDIFWRDSTNGINQIWLMNNDGTRSSIASPGGASSDFQVAEVTDFNSDTVPDILWRDTANGSNQIWLMNNDGTRNSIAFPGGADTALQVVNNDFQLV